MGTAGAAKSTLFQLEALQRVSSKLVPETAITLAAAAGQKVVKSPLLPLRMGTYSYGWSSRTSRIYGYEKKESNCLKSNNTSNYKLKGSFGSPFLSSFNIQYSNLIPS
jgi:hypothetical protein